jgi:hypothetical protein
LRKVDRARRPAGGGYDAAMTTQTLTNTKHAARREGLRYASLDELERDLERLEQAESVGVLRATGNWSPGEVFDHLAIFWEYSLDGFPREMKAPLPVRLAAQLLFKKKAAAGYPPPPGMKFPAKVAPQLTPREDVGFADALARLRTCIQRTRDGEPFTDRSPLFGEFSRDEWVRLNLAHGTLHLSFLHPE